MLNEPIAISAPGKPAFPCGRFRFARAALAALSLLAAPSSAQAQFRVSPIYATAEAPNANVDSCAVWASEEPGKPLLFVTEKEGDRIEVFHADTGEPYGPRPFLGGVVNGTAPGDFDRPNGVSVLYHVPYAGGFTDALLVTDQTNRRVQVFRLPALEPFGEFGKDEVGKGYGIAWYEDGTDFFVFITDNIPPAGSPGKLKKYRLRPEGTGLGADLVLAVGSTSGNPPLQNVESILADPAFDRLHVCGDEGGRFNLLFRLNGSYTGVQYGDPQFEYNQEGVNLYATGRTSGYLVISDQYTNGAPNQFEIFDRDTLASLGRFESPVGGALVTRNTDGAWLEQRPFAGFPNGGFFAVNDDKDCHAYDWTSVAEASKLDTFALDIVALDRPFHASAASGLDSPLLTRSALWFHDGSWWAVLPAEDGLEISRLEDGTFARQTAIDTGSLQPRDAVAAIAASSVGAAGAMNGGSLAVLTLGDAASLRQFDYRPSLRSYTEMSEWSVPAVEGLLADFAVDVDAIGALDRGWIAWVASGRARVTWSGPGLSGWGPSAVDLGAAVEVAPRLVQLSQLGGALAVLWTSPEGVRLRLHSSSDPAEPWSPAETVSAEAATALALAALPDGGILAMGEALDGSGIVWRRAPDGGWTEARLAHEARAPALVIDAPHDRVHLFAASNASSRRSIEHRSAGLATLTWSSPERAMAWPGVDQQALFCPAPAALSESASDLVAVSLGNDGLGYFARIELPDGGDRLPPISMQHRPAPGASVTPGGTPEGVEISLRIVDDSSGIDRSKLRLLVNGSAVAPRVQGSLRNLLVSYRLVADLGSIAQIRVEAADLAGRVMTPFEYSLLIGSTGEPRFLRADSNGDGQVDISDPVRLLLTAFGGGAPLPCDDAADANDDGAIGLSDAIYALAYLFTLGPAPPPPALCGTDPTPDGLDCAGEAACG